MCKQGKSRHHHWWLAILGVVLSGCIAAGRGTYHLVKAEQALQRAEDAGALDAPSYAWTMADAYMKKAREEWAGSDYEAAEKLAAQAAVWADQAEKHSQRLFREGTLDAVPEDIPADPLRIELKDESDR